LIDPRRCGSQVGLRVRRRPGGSLAIAIVRAEEPSFFLPDWTTERPAIAMLDEFLGLLDRSATIGSRSKLSGRSHRLSRLAEPENGVLFLVGELVEQIAGVVLETGSVEGVGSALGHVVNHRAGVASVFHTKVVGDDVEFGNDVLVADKD